MILRRVIDHFRKQEWTAIFLDFLIVVIGVFIGIQVSNWNAARQTRSSAKEFDVRLRADLGMEAKNFRSLIEYFDDMLKAAEIAHAGLAGKAGLSDGDLLVNTFRASQYSWADRHRATFDELVGSGKLDLIAEPRRRSLIAGYYALGLLEEVSGESRNSEYRRAFRMTVPPEVQRALAVQCGDRAVEGAPPGFVTLNYECAFDWPENEIVDTANSLRADASLQPLLRLRIANLSSRLFTLRQQWEVYHEILIDPDDVE